MPEAPAVPASVRSPQPQQGRMTIANLIKGKRREPDRILLLGREKAGKCFGCGTPVLMSGGSSKFVEDVVVGDEVVGPDGLSRRVLSVHRGRSPLYEISSPHAPGFVCNGPHELVVLRWHSERGIREETISAEAYANLPPERQRYFSMRIACVEFPAAEVPLDPYFVGLWLGDGTKGGSSIQITNVDEEVISYLDEFCRANGLERKNWARAKGQRYSEMHHALVGYDRGSSVHVTAPATTAIKRLMRLWPRIPTEYLLNSVAVRRSVLAGIIDSDGYAYGKNGTNRTCEVIAKDSGFAQDVLWLARSLGMRSSMKMKSIVWKDGRILHYHRIRIGGDLSVVPTKIARKKFSAPKYRGDKYGFSCRPIGVGDYFGFEVDGDHKFLLGDFTVAHNSSWASQSPDAVFVCPEAGVSHLDVVRFPAPSTFDEVLEAISVLRKSDHAFKTLVIDSLDWVEHLVREKIRKQEEWTDAEADEYARWVKLSVPLWRRMIADLDALRSEKSMEIVVIAHLKVKVFKNPGGDDYIKWVAAMTGESAIELWRQWADSILYADFDDAVSGAEKGKPGKMVTTNERWLYTARTAGFDAGSRYGLPARLPLAYADYARARDAWWEGKPGEMLKVAEGLLSDIKDRIPAEKHAEVAAHLKKYANDGQVLQRAVGRLRAMKKEIEDAQQQPAKG